MQRATPDKTHTQICYCSLLSQSKSVLIAAPVCREEVFSGSILIDDIILAQARVSFDYHAASQLPAVLQTSHTNMRAYRQCAMKVLRHLRHSLLSKSQCMSYSRTDESVHSQRYRCSASCTSAVWIAASLICAKYP